jgi:hypothetical protein
MENESALFGILLRPQSTEACYSYIEKLLTDQLASPASSVDSHVETTADLLELLDATLLRSGCGWTSVVAKRVSRIIVLEILKRVTNISGSTDDTMDALGKLMGNHSLIVRCEADSILVELIRIMRLMSATTSASVLVCIESTLASSTPKEVHLYAICSQMLAVLAFAKSSIEATMGLRILLQIGGEYIARDTQLTNSTFGLCNALLNRFHSNIEIKRLVAEVIGSIRAPVDSEEEQVPQSMTTSEKTPQATGLVKATIDTLPSEVIHREETHSPRSSCPSL